MPLGLTDTTHTPAGCWHPLPTQTPPSSADFCWVPKELPPPAMVGHTGGSQNHTPLPVDLASTLSPAGKGGSGMGMTVAWQ